MSIVMRALSILKRRRLLELAAMIVDRLVRPLGFSFISYTPWAATAAPAPTGADCTTFDGIAVSNAWGSAESLSGQGSELLQTAPYREALVAFLKKREFASIFDAPCGDMNWMPEVLKKVDIAYIGGDISTHVIDRNRARLPEYRFEVFDLTRDPFPRVDLWHCRDCLFHLSYAAIGDVLRNFIKSEVPYALLTSHLGILRNRDIRTGGWRYMNLRRAPFDFPRPLETLTDHAFGDLPRYLGYWTREQIEEAVARSTVL